MVRKEKAKQSKQSSQSKAESKQESKQSNQRMNRICEYIVNAINSNSSSEELAYSTMENGSEMNMSVDDMCGELEELMGSSITELEKFYDNWACQRKTIISFKYKGRKCSICEHFGSQRDYICVKIEKLSYMQILTLNK